MQFDQCRYPGPGIFSVEGFCTYIQCIHNYSNYLLKKYILTWGHQFQENRSTDEAADTNASVKNGLDPLPPRSNSYPVGYALYLPTYSKY